MTAKWDDSTSSVLVGGEKVTTRWWVTEPVNQDAYWLCVVRYHQPVQDRDDEDRWADWGEFLDSNGRWHTFPEGGQIEPTLILSGLLVHTLASLDGLIERGKTADVIHKFCLRVLRSVMENSPDA